MSLGDVFDMLEVDNTSFNEAINNLRKDPVTRKNVRKLMAGDETKDIEGLTEEGKRDEFNRQEWLDKLNTWPYNRPKFRNYIFCESIWQ